MFMVLVEEGEVENHNKFKYVKKNVPYLKY